MKKWLLIILGILVGLLAVMFAVGAMLPREHVATRSAHFNQPPEKIWQAITDYKNFTAWRTGLKSVEPLPDKNGWPQWKETLSDGMVMPLETMEFAPPQRMVTRIADESLPFGGTWTYELTPDASGCTLRITENGFVNPALFRFLSRFVFGHTSTMDDYLTSLGKKFNESVSPHVGAPVAPAFRRADVFFFLRVIRASALMFSLCFSLNPVSRFLIPLLSSFLTSSFLFPLSLYTLSPLCLRASVAYYSSMPDQRDLVRARFTRTAEQFASFSLSTRSDEAARLVVLAAPRGDELALDLACGPGTFTRAFARAVRFIHGLDITPALLARARDAAAKENLVNCVFECGDAYALPYAAAKFDLATCAYALHHMENPAAAMKELARVVHPGGRLALADVVVPDGCDPAVANAIERTRDASHCSTFLREELHALCAAAGFRVLSSEPSERLRSFNDWMQIAGWLPGDAAYAATRRLMEADVPADRSGFHPRPASTPAVGALLAAPAFIDSSSDFDFIQPSLFVVAQNGE